MKNLKDYLVAGMIGLGSCGLISFGMNQYTYYAFKSDIEEVEKREGKESAKNYCEFRLKYNYENFGRLLNWIDGSDDFARKYLEYYNLTSSEK